MCLCEILLIICRTVHRRHFLPNPTEFSTPTLSGRGRKFWPRSFSPLLNDSGKLYGIKSSEYFSLCNFISSTLRSNDRNSASNLGQCKPYKKQLIEKLTYTCRYVSWLKKIHYFCCLLEFIFHKYLHYICLYGGAFHKFFSALIHEQTKRYMVVQCPLKYLNINILKNTFILSKV